MRWSDVHDAKRFDRINEMFKESSILKRTFFKRDTATVARELLGKKLLRRFGDHFLVGFINEVEAYYGENDSASHASRGPTPRSSVMFGPPGIAYIYFIYGMHYMFNIVTEKEGVAGAVLIRSVSPQVGIEQMIANRNGARRNVANGPARLCQAFLIDRGINNLDLTAGETLWLENGPKIPETHIQALPRIGIEYAHEKDRTAHLRFVVSSI